MAIKLNVLESARGALGTSRQVEVVQGLLGDGVILEQGVGARDVLAACCKSWASVTDHRNKARIERGGDSPHVIGLVVEYT